MGLPVRARGLAPFSLRSRGPHSGRVWGSGGCMMMTLRMPMARARSGGSAIVGGSRSRLALGDLPVTAEGSGDQVCVLAVRLGHGESHLSPEQAAKAAAIVRSCLRGNDLVVSSRGGFLVVLGSDTRIDDGVRVADRVRHRLADSATGCRRIVSAGVAVGDAGEPVLEAMSRAEQALAQADAAGGSCTVARPGRRRKSA